MPKLKKQHWNSFKKRMLFVYEFSISNFKPFFKICHKSKYDFDSTK